MNPKEYYQKNKYKWTEHYLANRDSILKKSKVKKKSSTEKEKQYQRKYREKDPVRQKNYDLSRYKNMNLEKFNEILNKQNGVCAICFRKEETIIKGRLISLSVDHCHTTGEVRGLLCRKCNMAVGIIEENTEIAKNLINYLNKGFS